MWSLKLNVSAKRSTAGPLAIKNKVVLYMHPVLIHKVARHIFYINVSGSISGTEENIENFFEDLRELPQVKSLEVYDNHFMCLFEENPKYDDFYHPEIFYPEPWVIDGHTGMNHLLLGSLKKSNLTQIVNLLKLHHETKVLKVVKCNIANFFMIGTRPRITERQRAALELALRQGYYCYPRKTELKDLAKMAGVSYSTFQAHLRKAEQKVLPYSLTPRE